MARGLRSVTPPCASTEMIFERGDLLILIAERLVLSVAYQSPRILLVQQISRFGMAVSIINFYLRLI